MSNAFRTPILDTCRNIICCYLPIGRRSSSLFSLRAHRSALKSFLKFQHLSHSHNLTNLIAWAGVLNPSIIGKGFWFKRWSRNLQARVKKYLLSTANREDLIRQGTFISPTDLIPSSDRQTLENITNEFRRIAASVYLTFPKLYFDPSEVRGLEFQKRRLECHSFSNWGKFEIRCDGNGRDFASYIHNRKSRKNILKNYYDSFGNEFHESLLQLLCERQRFANSLGFVSWTEMNAVTNGYENEKFGLELVDSLYSQLNLKPLLSALKRANIPLPIDNLDEQFAFATQLRLSLLPKNESAVAMHKRESVFAYEEIIPQILKLFGDLFGMKFQKVEQNILSDGWHPDVQVFRLISVTNNQNEEQEEEELGYIYLDLFRRLSSGSAPGPHCSVLNPQNHVRICMGLQPPYRSDITFKKERNLTFEEISALMHELGHCMHLMLRPKGSPISQLPLDMRETVSIVSELYCETDEFVDRLMGTGGRRKVSDSEALSLKRNEMYYLDIVRNVAVFEYIHSSEFDPRSASIEDLKRVTRDVYAEYSPFPIADCFNPLGGELVNYLMDGDSRVGYLSAYIRASKILAPVRSGACTGEDVFKQIKAQFIEQSFEPMGSYLLESRKMGHIKPPTHPLPSILRTTNGGSSKDLFYGCSSDNLWDYCRVKGVVRSAERSKAVVRKPIISKM